MRHLVIRCREWGEPAETLAELAHVARDLFAFAIGPDFFIALDADRRGGSSQVAKVAASILLRQEARTGGAVMILCDGTSLGCLSGAAGPICTHVPQAKPLQCPKARNLVSGIFGLLDAASIG